MKKMQVNSPEYRALVSSLLGREIQFEDVPQIEVEKSPRLEKKKSAPRPSKKDSSVGKIGEMFNKVLKGFSDKNIKQVLTFAIEVLDEKGPIFLEGLDIEIGEEGRKINTEDIFGFFQDIKQILNKNRNFKGIKVDKHPIHGQYYISLF